MIIFINKGMSAMHYRIRGNSVQLVKTQEVEGRMTSAPVGSASLLDGTLNGKASELLSEDEKLEVETWLEARKSLVKKDLEVKFGMLAEHISSLAKAVKQNVIEVEHGELKNVQHSMKQLRNAVFSKTPE